MDLELKDKVALVGGASKGLGYAAARSLAAEGARVVMCARDEEALAEAGMKIVTDTGGDVITVPCDVTCLDQVDQWISEAMIQFDRVDILVNNAGGPPPGTFTSVTTTQWDEAVDLLLCPVVHAIGKVLPGMQERGWGRILNITSIAVRQPVPNLILSNSIRAAVVGMAKTLAGEVGEFGITVNNLAPGYFGTERLSTLLAAEAERLGASPAEVEESYTFKVPVRRLGSPAELGDLVAFLASPRASYITGTTFPIDGGLCGSL